VALRATERLAWRHRPDGLCLIVDSTKPRNPWYVALLAVASSSVLIGGWLARPDEIPESAAPVPSETELQQLARRAERLSLENMTTYFAGIARQAEVSLLRLPSEGLSGLVWDARRIVTPPLSAEPSRPVTFTTASVQGEAALVRWGPHLPLAVVAAPSGPALTPAPRAESVPGAGEWVVAVWRTATSRSFAVGNYLQPAPVTCGVTPAHEIATSISLTAVMAGGGLFDIDGHLLGVMLPCDGRIAAIAADSIQAILGREDSVRERLVTRYGLEIDSLSTAEQEYFKTTTGLLVRTVWQGQPGDAAGLRPGDIIAALNGHKVDGLDDLESLASGPVTPVETTVLRGPNRLTVVLADGASPAVAAEDPSGRGIMFEPASQEFTIGSITPGSRGARAGIAPGDQIVGINRAQPRSHRQIAALLAGDKPIWLEIARGGRRLGVLVR
jgi:S1-C subfamily serine protease